MLNRWLRFASYTIYLQPTLELLISNEYHNIFSVSYTNHIFEL